MQNNSKLILYNVKEVSEILKTNVSYVHKLRKSGLLRFMKIGQFKVREEALEQFLLQFDGHDLTDPENILLLEENKDI